MALPVISVVRIASSVVTAVMMRISVAVAVIRSSMPSDESSESESSEELALRSLWLRYGIQWTIECSHFLVVRSRDFSYILG